MEETMILSRTPDGVEHTRCVRLDVETIKLAVHARGGAVVDLSEKLGRPACFVAVLAEWAPSARGRSATTMEEHNRRVAIAKRRAHERARDRFNPNIRRPAGPVGNVAAYSAPTRPWPARCHADVGPMEVKRAWYAPNDPARCRLLTWEHVPVRIPNTADEPTDLSTCKLIMQRMGWVAKLGTVDSTKWRDMLAEVTRMSLART